MDRILVGICAAALAGMVGFVSGALLTQPSRQETDAAIANARAAADKVKKTEREKTQTAEAEVTRLRNELTRVTSDLKEKESHIEDMAKKFSEFKAVIEEEVTKARQKQLADMQDSLLEAYQKGPDISSLAGLRAITVVVEELPQQVQMYGLSRQQLQTKVELRLRQSGIRVLSEQENTLPPYLYVNVYPDIRDGSCAVSYGVFLQQLVYLARDAAKITIGSTWTTGGISTGGCNRLAASVQEQLGDFVDQFINDYLAANPKN